MKITILIALFLNLASAQTPEVADPAQDINLQYPVVEFLPMDPDEFKEAGLTEEKIAEMAKASKEDLVKSVVESKPFDVKEMELVDVELVLPTTNLLPPTPEAKQAKLGLYSLEFEPIKGLKPCDCGPGPAFQLSKDSNDVIQFMDMQNKKAGKFNPGRIIFRWGYHEAIHSKSDATFKTKDGTYTIKDAVGKDRQSYDINDYIIPSRIPIPQYNVAIGYQINPKWTIEGGLDHMKWVFDNTIKYEIEGDYNHQVFVPHPTDPDSLVGMNFDQVKATGDTRWLAFEHTNGMNYAFIGATYTMPLYHSKNDKFKVDALAGAGLGGIITQTTVKRHEDQWWNWQGKDNKFTLDGYGFHADGRLRVSYGKFFAEAAGRGTYVKIVNAPVVNESETLTHTPIKSLQMIVSIGGSFPLQGKKKKKKYLGQ
jgi:hypothetical protein